MFSYWEKKLVNWLVYSEPFKYVWVNKFLLFVYTLISRLILFLHLQNLEKHALNQHMDLSRSESL